MGKANAAPEWQATILRAELKAFGWPLRSRGLLATSWGHIELSRYRHPL
jgi:hypothetical protein